MPLYWWQRGMLGASRTPTATWQQSVTEAQQPCTWACPRLWWWELGATWCPSLGIQKAEQVGASLISADPVRALASCPGSMPQSCVPMQKKQDLKPDKMYKLTVFHFCKNTVRKMPRMLKWLLLGRVMGVKRGLVVYNRAHKPARTRVPCSRPI